MDNSVEFDKNARKKIKEFPKEIKLELGKLLLVLQKGEKLLMPLSGPMETIMKGAAEIRLKDGAGIYRVFYYTKVFGKIYVFHAFIKKTQKTPLKEIQTGKARLVKMLKTIIEGGS